MPSGPVRRASRCVRPFRRTVWHEIRKALGHSLQADVAALIGRLSGPLQTYVAALGGHLRIVADFGDDTVELTA